MADLANVLVDAFDKTGLEDTDENYSAFVQKFAAENEMQIFGIRIAEGWRTTGFDFNSKEDELVFKLKYGKIEVS